MTATQWEYVRVSLHTNNMTTLDKALDQLGAAGFEMCGWASADKTIGFNGFVGIFKRPGINIPLLKVSRRVCRALDGFRIHMASTSIVSGRACSGPKPSRTEARPPCTYRARSRRAAPTAALFDCHRPPVGRAKSAIPIAGPGQRVAYMLRPHG